MSDIVERLRWSYPGTEPMPLMVEAADEIERLRTPVCVGKQIISILAHEGAWKSWDGQALIAADELFHADPYAEIERLKADNAHERERYLRADVDKLRAEIERLQAVITAADVLRTRWLNDGHGLRGPGLSEFKEARQVYDEARRALEGK
jgi:hypothetical protein